MPGKRFSHNEPQGADWGFGFKNPRHELRARTAEDKSGMEQPRANSANPQYVCTVCGDMFRILSLFAAHKRAHEEDSFKPAVLEGPPKPSNLCKYCDRKFMLERTLILHQLQYCDKISPTEKRKLDPKELQHVEKPPLPKMVTARAAAAQAITGGVNFQKQMEKLNKCAGAGDMMPREQPMGIAGNKKPTKGGADLVYSKKNNLGLPYDMEHNGVFKY